MDQHGTRCGGRPCDTVLDGDAAHPTERGTAAPSTFRAMSIVAKRLPISANDERLSVNVSACRRYTLLACRRVGLKALYANTPIDTGRLLITLR